VTQQRVIDREVHRSYFGALLAAQSEEILAAIRDIAAQVVADRQSSFAQGSINRESVLEVQSNLATIEAKLAEAAQSRLTAFEALGILTDLDPSSINLASGFRAALPGLDEQALRAKALAASTDLAASRTRVSLAQKKLAIERGGAMLLPDVSLGVTLDVTGQQDLPFADWDWSAGAWSWDLIVSLGMRMSVFDGLASYSRISQAEKDAEMAGTGLIQLEKLLRLDVRKAVEAAVKADADVTEKQARADYAEERRRNAQASYDNGFAAREDLHGAEILAATAELDLLLSRYTREEALADLAQITGARL